MKPDITPLIPNIQINILQTDLYTCPWRIISMRELLKDQIWWWLMLVTQETSGLRDKVEDKRDFFLE